MKKIFTAVLLLSSLGMAAQETYQNAELVDDELNGTARYVGMGGAMDALGADISAVSSNPAAAGLFRRTTANMSFGVSGHSNGGNNFADSKTVVNFDQLGVIFNLNTGYNSAINFGFNYRKAKNFNQIMSVMNNSATFVDGVPSYDASGNPVCSDQLFYASQNGITYDKTLDNYVSDDCYSQVDYLYGKSGLIYDEYGDLISTGSKSYTLDRERKGYIGNYEFILAGNHQDRIYWGLSATIADVHYHNATTYMEELVDNYGTVTLRDNREITGTGYNIKGGVIFRPAEGSPFRIGLSVETPTWYDLETNNYAELDYYGKFSTNQYDNQYAYEISTPWKFGISAGTTVDRFLALGVSYNFADYSASKSKIKDGGYQDYYGYWHDYADNDLAMNRHTSASLKGVHTVKIGAEIKPIPELAVRLGYNYVSPMYKQEAYRDLAIDSPGTYYSSTTDYTNWKATNRFTCGLGFTVDSFTLDLAYQYTNTDGVFRPYQNYQNAEGTYISPSNPVNVSNTRNQFICTLGYRF